MQLELSVRAPKSFEKKSRLCTGGNSILGNCRFVLKGEREREREGFYIFLKPQALATFHPVAPANAPNGLGD